MFNLGFVIKVQEMKTEVEFINSVDSDAAAYNDWPHVYIQCSHFNPSYTGELFRYCMLNESICRFRGAGLFCRLYSILMENPVSKHCKP